jgi:hypothetical protein
MNNLSWFLYLADVLSNLEGTLLFFAVLAGFSSLVAAFVTIMIMIEGGTVEDELWCNRCLKVSIGLIVSMIVCIIVAVLIPSKTTFYAIAASEMGEQLIKTPTANKAVKALDAWLDKQIDETNQDDADE